jgi:hypothetical protein
MYLEKAHAGEPAGFLEPFGATCKSGKENREEQRSYHPGWDKPISIAEWMGALIKGACLRMSGCP